MSFLRFFCAILCASLFSLNAFSATGVEQLHQFMTYTYSAQAVFTQTVVKKSGKPGKTSTGTMSFQRPGKFRWVYESPYSQVIVSNGVKLWMYDKDLNQVLIKSLDQALGSSPAALLAGDDTFEKNFDVHDDSESDGVAWIEARPKGKETGFVRVRIGFKDGLLQTMELFDAFGQVTKLIFTHFEQNPKFPLSTFEFTPDKGVDVVGQ